MHGGVQGLLGMAQDGNFTSGFLAGAFGSFAGYTAQNMKLDFVGGLVYSSVVGGTASVLGGGKFANGAVTGAFVYLFNDMMHRAGERAIKKGGVILVSFYNQPEGMNKIEFMDQLKSKLTENGMSSLTLIEEYSATGYAKAVFQGKTIAFLDIRNYARGDGFEPSGGFAVLNSNRAVIYNGLTSFGKKDIQPTWAYVNASAHELGHAIFGFLHNNVGHTACPSSIMDYRGVYTKGANFSSTERQIISNSIW